MSAQDLGAALSITIGTLEQARAMIGTKTEPFEADIDVNWPMIKLYCALIEDSNPGFWNEEFAKQVWGGIPSPGGMLLTWIYPLPWRPGGTRQHPLMATTVPLPGNTVLNASTETEFRRPILVGTRITMVDQLIAVSDAKKTAVGEGHFITTKATYTDANGNILAETTNVAFRYNAGE